MKLLWAALAALALAAAFLLHFGRGPALPAAPPSVDCVALEDARSAAYTAVESEEDMAAGNVPVVDRPAGATDLARAAREVAGALAELSAQKNSVGRERALRLLARSVVGARRQCWLEALSRGEPSGDAVDLAQVLIRRWGEGDSRAAAAWVAQLPDGELAVAACQQIASVWGERDHESAATWARELPAGERRAAALTSVAYEAVRMAPLAALQLTAELPAGDARDELVLHCVRQWVSADPAAAVAWSGAIEDEGLRCRALSAAATEWGAQDPAGAMQLALDSIAPGEAQDRTVVGIVQRWAQDDRAGAEAWVEALPEGRLRDDARRSLARPAGAR